LPLSFSRLALALHAVRRALCHRLLQGNTMNANEKFIAADAHVDEAAIKPLPNSRKIYRRR
jgi:hypothetical protein